MEEPEERESLEERREQAQRAVSEGGGGESEGFELAEEELIEHASHGDSGPDPSNLAGEPDHERSSETEEED